MKLKTVHKHACQACGASFKCGGESCVEIHTSICATCDEPFSEAVYETVPESFAGIGLWFIECWHNFLTEKFDERWIISQHVRDKRRGRIMEVMYAKATQIAAQDVAHRITYTNN
jgi:hypothetical protein